MTCNAGYISILFMIFLLILWAFKINFSTRQSRKKWGWKVLFFCPHTYTFSDGDVGLMLCVCWHGTGCCHRLGEFDYFCLFHLPSLQRNDHQSDVPIFQWDLARKNATKLTFQPCFPLECHRQLNLKTNCAQNIARNRYWKNIEI